MPFISYTNLPSSVLMKRNLLTALVLMAITFSVVTISITDFQYSEATKASGTHTQKYGSATKNLVCGDQLCVKFSEQQKSVSVPISEFNSLLDKMDSIHEDHQNQMLQKWQSLSFEEQTKMIAMMNEKITKMESMDMSQHMSEMKNMMKKDNVHHNEKIDKKYSKSIYNEALNPRQVDYPNVLGFNDLHIHAIRHLDVEKSHGTIDHLLQTIVHHHCKVYDDNTAVCLLFPKGMTDQDKPYGIEYVITTDQYQELPEEEKNYWHYHKTEFPRAQATFPELSDSELVELQPVLDETYGKVVYFWNYGDTYPIGEPSILVVQEIPDQ